MGKTFKDGFKRILKETSSDRKVKTLEEKGYQPRELSDEYKRVKIDKRKIFENDIDEEDDTEGV